MVKFAAQGLKMLASRDFFQQKKNSMIGMQEIAGERKTKKKAQ